MPYRTTYKILKMPQRVDFVRVMVLVDLDKKGGGRVYWPVDGQAARQGRAKAEAGRGLATEQVLGRAHQSSSKPSFSSRLSKR